MKRFLTGLGVGLGLGMLFAPDRGEATRRRLRERLTGLADNSGRQVDKAKDVIQETTAGYSQVSSGESVQTNTHFPPRKDLATEGPSSLSSDPINSLSREELLNVNGIGPVLADRIISSRPFSSRQELVERGILSQSTFEELERELARRERRSA